MTLKKPLSGKISVKHFLRKNAPSALWLKKGKKKYPVYISIRLNREHLKFRSNFYKILVYGYADDKAYQHPINYPFLKGRMVAIGEKTTEEIYFYSIEDFKAIELSVSGPLLRIKNCLREEVQMVTEVVELCRNIDVNVVTLGLETLLHLLHPVRFALDYYLTGSLFRKLKVFTDNEYFIDWTSGPLTIYYGLKALGKEDVLKELNSFESAKILYDEIIEFSKAGKMGGICYQWAYHKELYNNFETFLKERNSQHIDEKISLIKNALNLYFSEKGDKDYFALSSIQAPIIPSDYILTHPAVGRLFPIEKV